MNQKRRKVDFLSVVQSISIHDIKEELEFIENLRYYEIKFRYGYFEISKKDTMAVFGKMETNESLTDSPQIAFFY